MGRAGVRAGMPAPDHPHRMIARQREDGRAGKQRRHTGNDEAEEMREGKRGEHGFRWLHGAGIDRRARVREQPAVGEDRAKRPSVHRRRVDDRGLARIARRIRIAHELEGEV